jgi:hypothetical protein
VIRRLFRCLASVVSTLPAVRCLRTLCSLFSSRVVDNDFNRCMSLCVDTSLSGGHCASDCSSAAGPHRAAGHGPRQPIVGSRYGDVTRRRATSS